MKVSKSIFVILLWKGQSQTFRIFYTKVRLRQQKSVNLCDACIVIYKLANCKVMCQLVVFVNVKVLT